MTIPPAIAWAAGVIAVLVAAMPVTRERLTRFAELTGLDVTTADAGRIVAHFARLRRRRLVAVLCAVPVTGLTGDPFYLVVGWCAAALLSRPQAGPPIYRTSWLLGLTCAVAAGGYLLATDGVTSTRLAHAAVAAVAAVVALAVSLRFPAASDGTATGLAIGHWSARSLYLSGAAIALSAAFLTPAREPVPERSASATTSYATERAAFTDVKKLAAPTCPFADDTDVPCRAWLVNGDPFPQAATYLIVEGAPPRRAPFARSHDRKAAVYLDRYDRRMMYHHEAELRALTGPLTDGEVPEPTFVRQSRYVALTHDGARIIDTGTWTTLSVPDADHVHDLNGSGFVVSTASEVRVLDHRGRVRMTRPLRKDDAYHLRPDGDRLVVVNGQRVDTYDPSTGRRLSRVTAGFTGDAFLDAAVGWAGDRLLVRDAYSGRLYRLDLGTGEVRRR
ncbi:YncE family protein [Nonomuraea sp. NPDC048826]|uniref:YncE family protein n=1 Tax=Nonomuraea sp. NPDC048826 TaxID=3364347 RepID=UPI00371F7798